MNFNNISEKFGGIQCGFLVTQKLLNVSHLSFLLSTHPLSLSRPSAKNEGNKTSTGACFLNHFNLATGGLCHLTKVQKGIKDQRSMESNTKGEDDMVGYNSSTMKKARLQSTLAALLDDPILADVSKRPTLTEVDMLINLEMGSAMRISVAKMDGTSFDVAVPNAATVKDLKLAVKEKTNEIEQSKMGHRHISWRHVWANTCLSYNSDKLLDDSEMLQAFGIRNNSQVHFVPYVVSRVHRKHSRRKKHRFFHGLSKRSQQTS